ncbi:oxygen-independent coproporphyrinogen III oxidase [Sphingomonas sp. dw_22]|uniref:oxygen-independent coproporphyrinogen III oxidase n=1 Tax=Sphingomonas sp. dw_22 TaxID=2721175 RepID=UPI001BD4885C|nr:oxygen-independent coproporphyrinogen III oxidase [Sphingomonas sp. dw_22]
MSTYHPDLLATPVPRYTSFPTAAEFGDAVGPADMAAALASIGDDEPISLYLHIPYCEQVCWYCGCNTGASNRTARVAAYVQRLGEEISLIAAKLGGRGRIGRIAWGGGSPNALSPEQFDGLMEHVRSAFACEDAIVSIELDPRGLDWRWATTIGRNRISRASLGVQTFAPHIQAAIGRVQPLEEVASVVDLLRLAGVESINFDLMYGLPGQTLADLDATLDQALALEPDRLAVFGYAHVPHLLPRQRQIDASNLPDAKQRFRFAGHANDRLVDAGYLPIGFDHFALPGDAISVAASEGRLRRNFQGFTEDQADVLIGLGASAISSFPGWLLQNEKNAGRYHLKIGNGMLATARGLHRSPLDQLRGRAIEHILCNGEADLGALPDLADIRERLTPFEERRLIAWTGAHLTLSPRALPYARTIAAALDPYRHASATRFSSAV